MKIKEYIEKKIEEGSNRKQLAEFLGTTSAMISYYLSNKRDIIPRLNIAVKIYKEDRIVIYPYAEESLLREIENELK